MTGPRPRATWPLLAALCLHGCSLDPQLQGEILQADARGLVIEGPYLAPWHSPSRPPEPTPGMRARAEAHCPGARYLSHRPADAQNLVFQFRFACPGAD